jgi:hypothetical protein
LDLAGFQKPRGYFRQSLWSDKPMAYIGTTPLQGLNMRFRGILSTDARPVWNYNEGDSIRVVCYTNAAKARLELNGKLIGAVKDYDTKTGIIYWDITYQAGKLEVVGLDSGNKETARYATQSTKQPYALTIQQAEKTISADKGVAQIALQVVDENGLPVQLSDNEVTCRVTGAGILLGLEAGNSQDVGDYTDNRLRVHQGRILAYVQATGDEGEMKVIFTSPWLKGVETTIKAERP